MHQSFSTFFFLKPSVFEDRKTTVNDKHMTCQLYHWPKTLSRKWPMWTTLNQARDCQKKGCLWLCKVLFCFVLQLQTAGGFWKSLSFFQGNSAVLFVILVIWSVAHEWKFRGCLTSKSCHLLCLGGAPVIPLLVTTLLRTVDSFAICFEIHDKDYTKPSKISPLWTVTYHSMGLLWPTHTTPLEWSQLWNQTVIIRVELYDMYYEVQTGPRPYTGTPTPY